MITSPLNYTTRAGGQSNLSQCDMTSMWNESQRQFLSSPRSLYHDSLPASYFTYCSIPSNCTIHSSFVIMSLLEVVVLTNLGQPRGYSTNRQIRYFRTSTNFLFVPRACPGSLDLDLKSQSGLAEA